MSEEPFSDAALESYLDELLPLDELARVERALRDSAALRERVMALSAQRDSGQHSLGAIWRRSRLTCPTRSQLGRFLLDALDASEQAYLSFHLHELGCRPCQANLTDLQAQLAATSDAPPAARRERYFQSSAGLLRRAT